MCYTVRAKDRGDGREGRLLAQETVSIQCLLMSMLNLIVFLHVRLPGARPHVRVVPAAPRVRAGVPPHVRNTRHVNTRWRAQERYQMGSLTRRVCGRTMLAMGARGGIFTGL